MQRPNRDPIEGRIVDRSPEPAYYVPEMTRWRKLGVWFFGGQAVHWTALALIGGSIAIWGWYAALFVIGATAGFYAGWFAAKSHLKHDGEIPPL